MSDQIRVTQLFDCADVGKTIVKAGVSHGKPWKIIQGPWTRGGTKAAYYRFRLEQAVAYPRTQLWHVNMGGRAKWARGVFSRPYALTLHGTDIRENYWQDQHHAVMKSDIDGAGHVWYMTPDVREKAESVRPDAEYFPIPVEPEELPAWRPASRPRVFFPSRWDASKGGDALLRTAADVVAAVGHTGVDIVGLDWGDRAGEAAGLGVTLLPKMTKDKFLLELARAHVAVGQVAGILATSELEALGIGVPVVVADPVSGYPDDLATVSVARADVGQAVLESLQDPRALSQRLDGPAYVRRNHSAEVMLPRLEAGYAKALENAR
jgi:glycosyltransferase involved in cell wall biosynthesis